MIAAADRAGVTLMVAQNLRYTPDAAAVKQAMDEGELGDIQAARCQVVFSIAGPNSERHWMHDGKQAGGGIGMTNVIHLIDLTRYYIGDIKRVTGVCSAFLPQMTNGAEDLLSATLEYENGTIGSVFGNWATSRTPEGLSIQVFGSKGTIHSTPPASRELPAAQFGTTLISSTKRDKKGASRFAFEPIEPRTEAVPTKHPFINEILHFEECCREGKEPLTSGKDNIETVKVIQGIYESARTGKAVDLDTL